MPSSALQRNTGLDCLRLICAVCVVFLHTSYPFKYLLEPVIRFAVPVFFLISGYYYGSARDHGKQLRRLLQLCITANLAHLAFRLVLLMLQGQPLAPFLQSLTGAEVILKVLVLNHSPISSALWYLSALLYVHLLAAALDRGPGRRILYPGIPLLLSCNLLLGTYSPLLLGRAVSIEASRNFLFAGLPFFLLGDLIRSRDRLPSPGRLMWLGVLSAAVSLAENYILHKSGLLENRDLFLGTAGLSLCLFCFAVRCPELFENRLCRRLGAWGRQLSLPIYLIHPMAVLAFRALLDAFGEALPGLQRAYILAAPVLVLAASLAAAIPYCILKNRREL